MLPPTVLEPVLVQSTQLIKPALAADAVDRTDAETTMAAPRAPWRKAHFNEVLTDLDEQFIFDLHGIV